MTSILKQWMQYAHADLDAAERLFHTPRPTRWTYLFVLWHCHQTIEKGLKMVIIKREKELLKIHDLPRLAELADLPLPYDDAIFVRVLNKFYLRSRYPDLIGKPLPRADKKSTHDLLQKTHTFLLWLEQQ